MPWLALPSWGYRVASWDAKVNMSTSSGLQIYTSAKNKMLKDVGMVVPKNDEN